MAQWLQDKRRTQREPIFITCNDCVYCTQIECPACGTKHGFCANYLEVIDDPEAEFDSDECIAVVAK